MCTFMYSVAVSFIGLRAELQKWPAHFRLRSTRLGAKVPWWASAFVLPAFKRLTRSGGRIDGRLSNRRSNRRWGSPSTAANRLMAPAGRHHANTTDRGRSRKSCSPPSFHGGRRRSGRRRARGFRRRSTHGDRSRRIGADDNYASQRHRYSPGRSPATLISFRPASSLSMPQVLERRPIPTGAARPKRCN
jgi:hypothetical protein